MRLHHRLTLLEARQGPDYVLNELTAKSYQITNPGSYPDTVQGLLASGTLCWHYLNVLHCQNDEAMERQEEAHGENPISPYHFIWQLCRDHDLFMRNRSGDFLRFRYYSNPKMYSWPLWSEPLVTRVIAFMRSWQEQCGGGGFFLDQLWLTRQSWWTQEQDWDFYILGHAAFLHRLWKGLLESGNVVMNGEWERLYPQGIPFMAENIDRFHPDRWDEMLYVFKRGTQPAGSIFSVAGSPASPHMREALDVLGDTSNTSLVEFTNPDAEALVRQELYG